MIFDFPAERKRGEIIRWMGKHSETSYVVSYKREILMDFDDLFEDG